ncbi:MAG: type I-E CRISPR-associated protein Cse1/CasA [Leptospiraceae bacterium]|nr:type I-E CRISPR-associated protein Cse1/CasA [Leptospiraceae bacterium]
MNLINEPWIPIIRKSGKKELIRPDQITTGIQEDDPITNFNSPRPDFNGALVQFMIGLLQTTFAPEDNDEWEEYLDNPPSQETLKTEFDKVAFAFNLDGDGPRFMQDETIKEKDSKKDVNAIELLLDSYSEHFNKLKSVHLCKSCAALSLITMQLNATQGGSGHRTSIRNVGPLNTLIELPEKENLWSNIWVNVLDVTFFPKPKKEIDYEKIFMWLNQKRFLKQTEGVIKSVKGKDKEVQIDTTPKDVHPNHIYWSIPRRFYFPFQHGKTVCNICSFEVESYVSDIKKETWGLNYPKDLFRHPLSPYSLRVVEDEETKEKQEKVFPESASQDMFIYTSWLNLSFGSNFFFPATTVKEFEKRKNRKQQTNIWAFGYDYSSGDKIKAKSWNEAHIPILLIQENLKIKFEAIIKDLIKASEIISKNLQYAIKKALFGKKKSDTKPGKEKWDFPKSLNGEDKKTLFSNSNFYFFKSTEADFYQKLKDIKTILEESQENNKDKLFLDWIDILKKSSMKIFDQYANNGDFENENIKSIALARKELEFSNNNDDIKTILGIQKDIQEEIKKSKARSKKK